MRPASPELDWLLESLRGRTPGIGHILLLSKDGLKICHTAGLREDTADQFAAVAAGIQSLGLAASRLFGSALGAGQAMVEFPGGLLLTVPAGEGAVLAVVAAEDADIGLVGHNMYEMVEQIGVFLTAPPRRPAQP
jgi:predicted regulator of Ras-like GTPase activity (Roadblock/LC7/MglB family)